MLKRSLMISSLTAGICLCSVQAIAATFTEMYVYGDSLSDLGRAFTQTGGIFPAYGAVTEGRYSNGLIWVEYLAPRLGLTTNPNTNYAIGGSTTGETNLISGVLPGSFDSLTQQINNNPINDPNGLYIVWAGANDYLFGLSTDPTTPITNLTTHLQTLIGNGANNILVVNLPNLGDLPSTIGTVNAPALNFLTQAHNSSLANTVNNLQLTFPNLNLRLLDVNQAFQNIQANPSLFGFTNVTEACLSNSMPCANPEDYFFWDDVHPTTRGHQLLSQVAFQALGVPEPSLLLGLFIVGIGGICVKKKNKTF